ncbi:hypothetical protein [Methylobacterium nodulans]|uniref:Antifreeze protein n=1 Tax=Methylobacterium nodulans (strain LMG 21967 / CNCM I-2342 / ORS 2060) TaxID=460265 RepID=B8IUL5_METNO|nr:hypothetical protein [Methylobacterium nodulans]ACL57083.1 conserved hypothetical protein [Methylobacterium nodulans ORS 2060]
MFGPMWKLGVDMTLLGLEAQTVIGLRLAKIALGGPAAVAEAQLMVTEKVAAAGEAAVQVATGGSAHKVVRGYRKKVRANKRRLHKR